MSHLSDIIASKAAEIAAAKVRIPQARLAELAAAARPGRRGFAAALDRPGVRVIAEIKRASPSLGMIRADLDPAATARAYAAGGAAALSVLTEPAFFKGSADDLRAARAAVRLPVLRKDFIIDPYQVFETAAAGADAMLLIVRIAGDGARLRELHDLALSLGLDVLTEIYDEADAERAAALGATLVGINNRDLASFQTDLSRAGRLAALLPRDTAVVALSGIRSADDVQRSLAAGIRRLLVGETLIRAADPAATLRAWTAPPAANLKICGITSRATARFCAARGAGALGAVFFRRSPRCVTPSAARALFAGLPRRVARVGVFVDESPAEMIAAAREAGLDTVQMHGGESAADIMAVQQAGFNVVKVLKSGGARLLEEAETIPAGAGIMVECGRGELPGGNGAAWDWSASAPLAARRPFALAGGLGPANLAEAMRLSGAAAWDVSSGVESAPGAKDHAAIEQLLEIVNRHGGGHAAAAPGFWGAESRPRSRSAKATLEES